MEREVQATSRAGWFARAIDMSTESLAWGLEGIPTDRREATPPAKLGEWTAERQLFHMLYYEREVALPSVRLWLGGDYPTFEGYDETRAWSERGESNDDFQELRAVRQEIIATLEAVEESAWDLPRRTPWGEKTLYWVASKTYQHGIEHLSGVLRMLMLWDHFASRESAQVKKVIE